MCLLIGSSKINWRRVIKRVKDKLQGAQSTKFIPFSYFLTLWLRWSHLAFLCLIWEKDNNTEYNST